MSDYLPEEIITQILRKLPVKSIIQCASVCKSWQSLITSAAFISTHLTKTLSDANNNVVLLSLHSEDDGEEQCLLLENAAAGSDENNEAVRRLPLCPEICHSSSSRNRVVGSCNGVLCLAHQIGGTSVSYFLWNPMIRKSVLLAQPPSFTSEAGLFCNECLAFGFDSRTSDYKVLRIVQIWDRKQFVRVSCEIDVYSLNAGSWRNISNVASSSLEIVWIQNPVVFFNGFLHYVAFRAANHVGGFCNRFLAFDVGNEVFREFRLPDSLADVRPYGLLISVYKECIAVVDHNLSDSQFCVWVMGEYGMEESWTKVLVVDFKDYLEYIRYGELQAFGKSGQLILQTLGDPKENFAGCLRSYDPETKNFRVMHFWWKDYDVFLCSYVKSLVLLNVGTSAQVENYAIDDAVSQ